MKKSKAKTKGKSWVFWLLSALIFGLMLGLNYLTPKMCDDFAYSQSFLTKEPLRSVFDIFPSLWVHALKMNGRLFAHFFAQLFLMLPDGIFDFVNAVVFLGQLWLTHRFAVWGDRKKPLLLFGLFCAVWLFMPAFGQVNLWLDGACNYLWCIVFGLLFLKPYVDAFVSDRSIKSKPARVFFCLFAIIAGGFVENGSAAFFGMSVLLLILNAIARRQKPRAYLVWGSICSLLGYLSMYLAPAEWANKQTEFTAEILMENLIRAWEMYLNFLPLLLVFGLLLLLSLVRRTEGKRVWLSLVFMAGSLAANFILTFADYYPERCASSALMLLLAAIAVLLADFDRRGWKAFSCILLCAVIAISSLCFAVGIPDIVRVSAEISDNALRIEAEKAAGNMNIVIPAVSAETRFCALYDLKYIDTQTADTWPNVSMATYYGIDSIKGEL